MKPIEVISIETRLLTQVKEESRYADTIRMATEWGEICRKRVGMPVEICNNVSVGAAEGANDLFFVSYVVIFDELYR